MHPANLDSQYTEGYEMSHGAIGKIDQGNSQVMRMHPDFESDASAISYQEQIFVQERIAGSKGMPSTNPSNGHYMGSLGMLSNNTSHQVNPSANKSPKTNPVTQS